MVCCLSEEQHKRTFKQIAGVAGVSDSTIKNAYKDLYLYRKVGLGRIVALYYRSSTS